VLTEERRTVRSGSIARVGRLAARGRMKNFSEVQNSPMLYLQSRGARNTACRQEHGRRGAPTEVWAHVEQLRQLSRKCAQACAAMGGPETAWAPLIMVCASIRFRICRGGPESLVLSNTYGSPGLDSNGIVSL